MRPWPWALVLVAGCAVDRLPSDDFACGFGGPCDASVGPAPDALSDRGLPIPDAGGVDGADAELADAPCDDCPPPAPIANNDEVLVAANASIDIAVLENDIGIDLRLVMVEPGNLGFVTSTSSVVSYVAGGTAGVERLRYEIEDGQELTATAEIIITVTRENRRPRADPVDEPCFRNQRCLVILRGVDADGDQLSYEIANPPNNGTLVAAPGGPPNRWIYSPRSGFSGSDSFTYRASDGIERSSPTAGTISVISAPADWFDARWSRRRRLSVRSLGEEVRNVPILITASGIFDVERTQPSGSDVVFVNPSTRLPIPHEVIRWDLAGESLFWVELALLPAMGPGSIDVYYASVDGRSTTSGDDVWDAYEGVWHLESDLEDASDSRAPGTAVDVTFAPGPIGQSASFRAASGVTFPPGGLGSGEGMISLWVQTDPGATFEDSAMLLYASEAAMADGFGPENELHLHLSSAGVPGFFMTSAVGADTLASTAPINDGQWHHIGVSWQSPVQAILTVDGVEVDRAQLIGNLFTASGALRLGQSPRATRLFTGSIDEVRVSPLRRPASWFAVERASVIPPGLVTFGREEVGR